MILRQPVAVGLDQLVAHGDDVVHGQFRAGVGIQHHGLVDIVLFQRARGFNGQKLHVDIRAIQRRALFGQIADEGGLHAVFVHQAGAPPRRRFWAGW